MPLITGILRNYERLLRLPGETFLDLVNGKKTDHTDIERRLYNRLGKRYILAYQYAVEKLDKKRPGLRNKRMVAAGSSF